MITIEEQAPSQLRNTPCLCAAARRATRALTQFYDLVLSPTGLKVTQFIMLQEIAEAGEIAQWQLAEGYAIATETLSRRLALARRKGLVQARSGTRRGERIYSLTAFGRECMESALPYWERAQRRVGQVLGDEDVQGVVDYLDRLTRAAQLAEQIRTNNTTEPVPHHVRQQELNAD